MSSSGRSRAILVVVALAVTVGGPLALIHAYNATPWEFDVSVSAAPAALIVPQPRVPIRRASRAAPRAQRGFTWPVAGSVTSPFGERGDGFHHGIDIGCRTGTPIQASAPGRVSYAADARAYGTTVAIDHGNGYMTVYAHLSEIVASLDGWVSGGEVVGLCGSTGRSTGSHLHFEVRYDGSVYDPMTIVR